MPGIILRFVSANVAQALTTISNNNCYSSNNTSNNAPTITTATQATTIPKSTPFELRAMATDPDADALVYAWEGTNTGLVAAPDATVIDDETKPPFSRAYEATATSNIRTFPILSAILDGTNKAKGDKLPSVGTTLNYSISVYDNNAQAGGMVRQDVAITVDGNSGPFLVTSNLSGSVNGNSQQTVTWSVNNTDGSNGSAVNVQNVKISLSTDGGQTFGTVLAASVPNNGSANVTMPNVNTTMARIKVEAVGNIFFDISNSDFTIAMQQGGGGGCQPTTSSTNASVCALNLPFSWNNNNYNATGSYTVHLTNAGGCDSAATLVLTVTPTYTITASAGSNGSINPSGATSVCSGNSQSYTITANNGYSIASVTVDGNPASTSGSYTFQNVTANHTISATFSQNSGGGGGSTLSISGASSVCVGSNITLSASSNGGTWSSLNNRATVNNSGVVTGTSTGTATIKYTLGNQSATKTVTVNSLPASPGIAYASGTNISSLRSGANFCANRTFTIVGSPAGGVWSSSGVVSITTPGGSVSTGAIAGAGSVTYTYTNANGCSSSRTIASNVVVCASRGLYDNTKNIATIYPNPARNTVNFAVDNLIGKGSVLVFDMYGKQVKQQALSLGTNTMDVSKLARGMYLINIVMNNETKTQKLIIE